MKKFTPLCLVITLLLVSLSGFSQKYKKAEDTIKLNKEYVKVSNEIAEMNAKLTIAQNDLPGYQSKAKDANNDANDAASASSDQASKATNGDVGDAKKAKKKADKAYDEAKDSKSAKHKVSDQEEKIEDYRSDIKKKQERLGELDEMRAAINAKIIATSTPPTPQ